MNATKRERSDLAILGVYPPPPGGMAKHVQRLCAHLRHSGIDYVVYNAVSHAEDPARSVQSVADRRVRWFVAYLIRGKEPVVLVLSDRLAAWIGVALMSRLRNRRVVIHLRNSALADWRRSSPTRYLIARLALRWVEGVVAVSRRLISEAQAAGVPPERLHLAPTFLPPTDDDERAELVSESVWEYMTDRSPVVVANGRAGARYEGSPLYGFDMMVELAAALRPQYPSLAIVICLWSHETEADEVALSELRARAVALGVSEAIHFNTKAGPFVPVIRRSDLLVRPTNTDGDAASIREALFYGVPVVASDVVDRPVGTALFRNRRVDELIDVVAHVLASPDRGRASARGLDDVDPDSYVRFVLGGRA